MDICSGAAPHGFASSLTVAVDCQARSLGAAGWSALAAPGSEFSLLLTTLLTIMVALIGYRLILGDALTVRGGTLAMVKIGAVMALATSWPAYRTLAYDVVTQGPGELAATISPAARADPSGARLLDRLDFADRSLGELALLGPGAAPKAGEAPPPPFSGFDQFALGGSRIVFLVSSVAALLAPRLVAGLMLALGPFFIAFLLFDSTRSLFEGWIRVLAGSALAAASVAVALALELSLLEPWLGSAVTRRVAGEALPTVPTELVVITTLFAIMTIAALGAAVRLTGAFRLAPAVQVLAVVRGRHDEARAGATGGAITAAPQPAPPPSRARVIASAAIALDRRQAARTAADPQPLAATGRRSSTACGLDAPGPFALRARPLGRTAAMRASARATRRDSIR